MKGVERIYQQTFIDTYAKVAFAKLYDRKTPIFAAPPRSIPSLTAASDRGRRLWLTSFDRRANARSSFAE